MHSLFNFKTGTAVSQDIISIFLFAPTAEKKSSNILARTIEKKPEATHISRKSMILKVNSPTEGKGDNYQLICQNSSHIASQPYNVYVH